LRNASNGLLPSEAGSYCPLVGVSARDARLPARGDKHVDRIAINFSSVAFLVRRLPECSTTVLYGVPCIKTTVL
jgi:hypothetical protein